MVKPDHETVAAPKLNVVAINEMLCPHGGICVAIGYECSEAGEMTVFIDNVSAVLDHFGDANPGEVSH
jgi:hypothetical protein